MRLGLYNGSGISFWFNPFLNLYIHMPPTKRSRSTGKIVAVETIDGVGVVTIQVGNTDTPQFNCLSF
ncbi:hypothetical protein A0H81_05904 [Grifola frondosa]|uniref:Uncharacterized protein n=1 Tax=Grifola frondosa TaxID=5627 RepID=A0A1C7MEV1_GRIFR|nr:hypothetical protein A0H81_05904 [Grifola frondosa]